MIITINMDTVRGSWSDQARMALHRWYAEEILLSGEIAPLVGCVTSITLHQEGAVAVTCPCTGLRMYSVGRPPPFDPRSDGVTVVDLKR